MNVRIYTRAETENEAHERHAEMMVWCGEQDHLQAADHIQIVDCSWDGLAGQRGLVRALRGATTGTIILVWTLADLARGDLNALVRQIQELARANVVIRAHKTDLWIRPETSSEARVITALAEAHMTYVSENRRLGMASARAAGATIGRPKLFTLDAAREPIETLMNANDGRFPSVRDLAKAVGCKPTKASQLLTQYKAERNETNETTSTTGKAD